MLCITICSVVKHVPSVPVYLDEPLWREGWGRGQLPVEMLALCLQLDATIVTESAQTTDNVCSCFLVVEPDL